MRIIFDPDKNLANAAKHGVSLDEAAQLLRSGVDYLEIYDVAHSVTEDRFLAIGPIQRGLVLVVWTQRNDEALRVISARWATRKEKDLYHSYLETLP